MKKTKKFMAMMMAVAVAAALTSCDKDPEPTPTPAEADFGVGGDIRWVLAKTTTRTTTSKEDNIFEYTYNDNARITERKCSYVQSDCSYIYGEKTVLASTRYFGSTKFDVENGKIVFKDNDVSGWRFEYSNNCLSKIIGNGWTNAGATFTISWKNGVIDKISARDPQGNEGGDFDVEFVWSGKTSVNSSCIKALNAKVLSSCFGDASISGFGMDYELLFGDFFGKIPDKLISEISWKGTPKGRGTYYPYFISISDVDSNGCPKSLIIKSMWICDSSSPLSSPDEKMFDSVSELEWRKF